MYVYNALKFRVHHVNQGCRNSGGWGPRSMSAGVLKSPLRAPPSRGVFKGRYSFSGLHPRTQNLPTSWCTPTASLNKCFHVKKGQKYRICLSLLKSKIYVRKFRIQLNGLRRGEDMGVANGSERLG